MLNPNETTPEVPDGYKEVTEIVTGVFVNEKTGEIVITGIPETVLHNCDQMGCSSIDHVIYRVKGLMFNQIN